MTLDPKTGLRLRTTGAAAADYALNVLILFGFAAAGTIPWDVPMKIMIVAVVLNVIFLGGIASGFSQRFPDPSMTVSQVFAACGINFLGLLLAPQIGYMFIVNLFVPLSFGSLYFTRRHFFIAWLFASLSLGAVLAAVVSEVDIKLSTRAERFLFWAVVTLAIGRFIAINSEVSRLRARLQDKNRDLASATARLADLATRDELTGLWNRREFMKLLFDECGRASRAGPGFCVALMDADYFKQINDRFGHLVGDAALQKLAELLGTQLRTGDHLARYGGEEFAVLLFACAREDAVSALERMRMVVEKHDWGTVSPGLRLTLSAGLAAWQHGETAAEILRCADEALYRAKDAGRNQVLSA